MKAFSIYLTGVGGQGIGMMSEVILRAADHAGHLVKSVDTHGLAQRGGIVVSQIRMGKDVYSPLIPARRVDLIISLERHEALRAATMMLKKNGCLIYYDTVWQPLPVRLNEKEEVSKANVRDLCQSLGIQVCTVTRSDLSDSRMQNMAVLAVVCKRMLIPGIEQSHYRAAMEDLMTGSLLHDNLALLLS